jgi:hypothetical protein
MLVIFENRKHTEFVERGRSGDEEDDKTLSQVSNSLETN